MALPPDERRCAVMACELCSDSRIKVCEDLCGCTHRFCSSCWKDHVIRTVNETIDPPAHRAGTVMPGLVLCPSLGGCSRELSREDVARVIGKQDMERFQNWLVESADRIYSGNNRARSRNWTPECIVPRCGTLKSTGNHLWNPDITVSCTTAVQSMNSLRHCVTCGVTWCYACGVQIRDLTPHEPATCPGTRRNELYLELLAVEKLLLDFPVDTKTSSDRVSKEQGKGGGTGYGGSAGEFSIEQEAAQRREEKFHRKVEKHCGVIRDILDSCVLNPATWALFQRPNSLASLISRLISNDSILDISSKSSCYLALMALLTRLGLHDGLLPGLLVVSTEGQSEDGGQFFRGMGRLYEQSQFMLSRIPDRGTSMAHEAVDIQLALKICESYETLKKQWAGHGDKTQESRSEQELQDAVAVPEAKGNANCNGKEVLGDTGPSQQVQLPGQSSEADSLETVIADYKRKLQPLQFRCMSMVDKSGVCRSHHVHAIMDESSSYTNRSRMLSIAKELASLASSLPLEWGSSIYLCVDEARTDVMKALIVGPQGTPYQNGMFIFDLFLPADYPHAPPKVHFLTTGGGSVRFNPNLYASGHVCLSLLGTWRTGPRWMPGKSTLLQVLVSLQGLIFVEEPYYNEPGFEAESNPRAAEAENALLRNSTLSIAVLGALRKPEPLFADIILEHFRFKREEVEAQCDEWETKGSSSAISEAIKEEFRRLFGEKV